MKAVNLVQKSIKVTENEFWDCFYWRTLSYEKNAEWIARMQVSGNSMGAVSF